MNDSIYLLQTLGCALSGTGQATLFSSTPFFCALLACAGQRKKRDFDFQGKQRSVGWYLPHPVDLTSQTSDSSRHYEQSTVHSVHRFPFPGLSARPGNQRALRAAYPLEV